MAAPDRLTVATAQYPVGAPATLADWRDKIAAWVAAGAATGADLLVFPEYAAIEQAATFGPEVTGDLLATLAAVAGEAGERVAFHAELASEYGVCILVGSGPVEGSDGRYRNAAQLVTPAGLVGEQEKLIMTPFEHGWGVAAGGPVRVFDTSIGRVAVAICYDSEFPLTVRAMAEAGAELLLVPSCTERLSGFHRVRTGAKARALESQIAVVTSPLIGEAPWSAAIDVNTGAAGLFVPSEHGVSDTGIIAEGTIDKPEWVVGTFDFAGLRRLRSGGEMRNYADWTAQVGASLLAHHVEIVDLR
ncbi:MAG: carbon-nitrogen hydrolase family protein [Hyphomicrobiaceae bacterium]|nr:carbon-nitrogen hydrolase family protein [Hyphomicrobiaceae bacterium]